MTDKLICPSCGKHSLKDDPYNEEIICPSCEETVELKDLVCPACGQKSVSDFEDGILICGKCREFLSDPGVSEERALDYYYDEILGGYDEESAGEVWDGMDD
ncbi:MAG: hypothetical protein V8Q30_08640 [Acutalibacteraceae bacterium]